MAESMDHMSTSGSKRGDPERPTRVLACSECIYVHCPNMDDSTTEIADFMDTAPVEEEQTPCLVTKVEAQEGLKKAIAYVHANCYVEAELTQALNAVLQLLYLPKLKKTDVPPKSEDPQSKEAFQDGSESSAADDDTNDDGNDDVDYYGDNHKGSHRGPSNRLTPPKDVKFEKNQTDLTENKGNNVGNKRSEDGKVLLTCATCSKTYQYKRSYDHHVEKCKASETEEETLNDAASENDASSDQDTIIMDEHTCSVCNEIFGARADYRKHLRTTPCGVQVNTFPDEQIPHVKTGKEHVCVICKKAYDKRNSFRKHMQRTICGEKLKELKDTNVQRAACEVWFNAECQLTCDVCKKLFPNRHTYQKHLRTTKCGKHIQKDSFSCGICNKTYNYYASLANHMRECHQGIRPYRCITCDEYFISVDMVDAHMKTHSEIGSCECTICNVNFDSVEALHAHIDSKPAAHMPEETHICEVCGYVSKRKKTLEIHRRIHTGEKPYKCTMCDMRFRQTSNRQYHIRLHHTGEKPHMCNICGKRYHQMSLLKEHIRIHTGERPHACEVCGKSYRLAKKLKVHKRAHTGERPHICKECGKTFACSDNLRLHMRLHTGAKPYSCKVCGKDFRRVYTRKVHMKTHQHYNKHFSHVLYNSEKEEDIM